MARAAAYTRRVRSTRWPLVVAFVAAAATAVLLGAALAEAGGGQIRERLVLARAAFLALIAAVGIWAVAFRRGPTDAMVERAETASKLAHELKSPLMSIKGLASTG